jgi:hypothetical protein
VALLRQAVIGIEADDYRILNDHCRPYLYPHDLFETDVPYEPGDWITEIGNDVELYSYPPALNAPVFLKIFSMGTEMRSLYSGELSISILRLLVELRNRFYCGC